MPHYVKLHGAGAQLTRPSLATQEQAFIQELQDWDTKIAQRREELMSLTAENTQALLAVADLARGQRQLESSLASTKANLGRDPLE